MRRWVSRGEQGAWEYRWGKAQGRAAPPEETHQGGGRPFWVPRGCKNLPVSVPDERYGPGRSDGWSLRSPDRERGWYDNRRVDSRIQASPFWGLASGVILPS